MRFKRENYWLPTLGDKYTLVNFGEITFAWLKEKRVTNFKEFYKLCGSESMHFEEVLQSGQFPRLTTGYAGIQVSSKYMIEQYYKSRNEG